MKVLDDTAADRVDAGQVMYCWVNRERPVDRSHLQKREVKMEQAQPHRRRAPMAFLRKTEPGPVRSFERAACNPERARSQRAALMAVAVGAWRECSSVQEGCRRRELG